MRRIRYQPALNSECLCGSGLKFKRCCFGENDIPCRKMTDCARESIQQGNYQDALKYVRHGITNYTILHKTNTEPYISIKDKGVQWLLDIDIKALAELTNFLLWCYRCLNDYDSFACDLERLRRNINDCRWQRKITYFQALASLGSNWSVDVGKREVKKFLPLEDECDIEIIQLYLHFCSDELSFKKSLDILDRLLTILEKPSEKLQYTIIKAIKYLCIDDEIEAQNLVDAAIFEYEANELRDNNLYGRMQHARALSLLGDLKKSAHLKVRSIKKFEEMLESNSMTALGKAEIYFEIGKSLFRIKKSEDALLKYKKSLELKDAEIVKVFMTQAQLDLDDPIAITTINEIDIEKLSESEKLDFIFTHSSVAIAFKKKEMIEASLIYLSDFPKMDPVFERQRSKLISEISILYTTGGMEEESKILSTLKKLIGYTSRYLILQPNIAGFGVNINKIADDFAQGASKKDV